MIELTADEQDALAANCGYCWAYPGKPCTVKATGRKLRHPHKLRVARAGRRGILGGIGRMLLEQNRRVDG